MTSTLHRPLTSLGRLLGAGLLAAPLTLGALGQAHAATAPALVQLVPARQNVSGYANTPYSVAVNGNTAVVGAVGDRAAYVFVKTAGGWAQQARLADPASNVNDLFEAVS